jgi:hypothetical protein
MASVYSIEIDGWGEVGPAIDVTNAEGFADGTFTLTTAGTPPGTDEIGAMIWVEDCDAVIADGYYTLTARTATTFTMQADPADVTVTSSAVTGLARIEDHYKISDGLPSWVTGSNAQARWYRDLIGVSESAGQRVKPTGGIASVDGFEFTMARRSPLAAIAADTYLLSTAGPVVLAGAITTTTTTIATESAAPYAGESASSPTGPAQPAWVGTEAIDVRGTVSSSSTDGITTYTATHDGSSTWVTRGVLRTFAQSHADAVAVFGSMPTPIGQIARAYVYDDGHASHADRRDVGQGACEAVDPSQANGTAQTIALASSLLAGRTRSDSAIAKLNGGGLYGWIGGTQAQTVQSANGSRWNYILVGGYAALLTARTGLDPIEVDENGIETWDYLTVTLVAYFQDFPIVRRLPDVETWERYSKPQWGEVDMSGGGLRVGLQTLMWTTSGTIVALPEGSAMCHVFRPDTWTRSRNNDDYIGEGDRYVSINPVDAILEMLTSTGTGDNGDHDDAPREFGFGIPVANIESATFTAVGDRLDDEGITAGSIALLSTESNSLRERLDVLCRTYALAVATTTAGKVRLVDMAHIDYDTTTTLDEGDIVNGAAVLSIGAGDAINSVTLTYDRPWASPESPEIEQIQTIRASTGGILEALERVSGQSLNIKPWFAASVDDESRNALGIRWSSIIAQTNGVVGRITANVDPGYSGQIGDTVAVSLPAFPNAQDSGAMSGALCRIVDRKHVSRPIGQNPHDELTLLAYGVTAADKPRQWAPSGVVASVTSKLVFDLETSAYHGRDYTSDADSFAHGVDVDIYDANWSLRSTVSPGTVSSTAGDTVTLSVAAAGGGGDVTPSVGDKITLAAESNQSASEAAKWGWLSTSTPGYLWR